MNHNGNANKMVSDTPRTEAEVNRQKCWSDDLVTIDANFACQLERELNAANESFRKLNIHALDLAARIKRLEEAGDAMASAWDKEWLTAADIEAIIDDWHGAKEAKP